jgi:type I restriction enzyme S subunit
MIPKGWEVTSLSELASQIMVGIASAATHAYRDTGVLMIRNTNIKEGHIELDDVLYIDPAYEVAHKNKRLKAGDVITVRTGYPGISAVVPKSLAGSQCFTSLITRPHHDRLSSDYLALYINSELGRKFIFAGRAGGAQKNVNAGSLAKMPVLLPPMAEQKRIVEIVSRWDMAISTTKTLIAAKQQRKQALMQQLLTGKKRLSGFKGPRGDTISNFGRIPNDWRLLQIADFAQQVSVRNTANEPLTVLSCTKHQGLVDSMSYFGKRIFSEDTSGYKVVPRHTFAYATNHIEEGSIGYQNLYERALISPIYTVFRCDPQAIHDAYLLRVLKTETARHIFESMTSSSVDRRGSLRWNDFSTITLPIPSIAEQRRLDQFFTAVDKELTLLEAKRAALEAQKKALMAVLLTGKKRIKA